MRGSSKANIQKTNIDLKQNDRQYNGQHTKDKQCSLAEWQAVQRLTYKRQTLISNRMKGSTTANIQKTNNDFYQNDRQFSGQHTKEKQWSLTEWQAVQRPTYKRQTMISNRMTGSSTANIQKTNKISNRMTGSSRANIQRQTMISSRMTGSSTANIQKTNNDL